MPPLSEVILKQFEPDLATDLDVVVAVEAPPERVVFAIRDNQLALLQPDAEPHFSLLFSSTERARAIISRETNLIDAFMSHDFRADGYIVTSFRVLAALKAYP